MALVIVLIAQLWQPLQLRLPPGRLQKGEPVTNVRVVSLGADGVEEGRLRELTRGAPCTVLAFYHSECPICHGVADSWRSVDSVRLFDLRVPVRWIAVIDSDSGAVAFQHDYELPGSPAGLVGRVSSHRLGVLVWPRFIVVDSVGRYRSDGPREPADYASLVGCRVDPPAA